MANPTRLPIIGSDTKPDGAALLNEHLTAKFAHYLSVKEFGAVGDSPGNGTGTDDSGAFQDAADAVDANRGGRIYVPQGRYRFATGVNITIQGTEFVGEGLPGTGNATANGSSRIIADNGITAFTCNPAGTPHGTLGYGFRKLHIKGAVGATTGNGILIKNTTTCIIEHVTCSDFIGGIGLCNDGGSGNGQYWDLHNYSAGDCLTGLKLMGAAPNGLRMWGGYFEGLGATPRAGSIGIHITNGDTFRGFGTVIQGWATGFFHESAGVDAELHGPRFEYCNRCLRLGSTADEFKLVGGSFSNSLLANGATDGSIGVQVDAGATNCVLDINSISAFITPILNNGTGTVKPTYEAV